MGFATCNFAGLYETFIFLLFWSIILSYYFFEPQLFDFWILYVSMIAFILRIFVVSVRYGYTN